jgi:hypothetical protein
MGNLEVWTPGTRLFRTESPGHGGERSPSRNGIPGSFFATKDFFRIPKDFITVGCPVGSVTVPGCLSQISDPDFYPSSRISDPRSRISDPGSRIQESKTATKEEGEQFHIASNIAKIFIFELEKKHCEPI